MMGREAAPILFGLGFDDPVKTVLLIRPPGYPRKPARHLGFKANRWRVDIRDIRSTSFGLLAVRRKRPETDVSVWTRPKVSDLFFDAPNSGLYGRFSD